MYSVIIMKPALYYTGGGREEYRNEQNGEGPYLPENLTRNHTIVRWVLGRKVLGTKGGRGR